MNDITGCVNRYSSIRNPSYPPEFSSGTEVGTAPGTTDLSPGERGFL